MDDLLAELGRLRIGATFNQYAEAGPDDVRQSGRARLANLRAYLAERAGADVVCLGEAGGYQGMRWSGIAFTSERDLGALGGAVPADLRGPPMERAVGHDRPQGARGARAPERRVILWNTVPTHPHRPGEPLSNRRPTTAEIAAGAPIAMRLIELVRPRTVVAVGQDRRVDPAAGNGLRAPPRERRRPGLPRGHGGYPRRAVTSAHRACS